METMDDDFEASALEFPPVALDRKDLSPRRLRSLDRVLLAPPAPLRQAALGAAAVLAAQGLARLLAQHSRDKSSQRRAHDADATESWHTHVLEVTIYFAERRRLDH